jgi:hypothetical protein
MKAYEESTDLFKSIADEIGAPYSVDVSESDGADGSDASAGSEPGADGTVGGDDGTDIEGDDESAAGGDDAAAPGDILGLGKDEPDSPP